MPKIKTHSGAKKRFKLTKTGKVKRAHAYKSHILNKKTTKRKRNLRKTVCADVTNVTSLFVFSKNFTTKKDLANIARSFCYPNLFD